MKNTDTITTPFDMALITHFLACCRPRHSLVSYVLLPPSYFHNPSNLPFLLFLHLSRILFTEVALDSSLSFELGLYAF